MTSSQAIKELAKRGFVPIRYGKGDHLILRRSDMSIIIKHPSNELSPGMAGKVRTALRKNKTAGEIT